MKRRAFLGGVGAGLGLPWLVRADEPAPIRVVVWDEQQPEQKQAYDNFLGNAIVDHLNKQDGIRAKSARLDDPEQGITPALLDDCDVLVWWGHVRNRELEPKRADWIVERVRAGRLALIALHSAHWSTPFVRAMWARTLDDARAAHPGAEVEAVEPKLYVAPKADDPLTPSFEVKDDGKRVVVRLSNCCFPAYRADGKPGHIRVLLPEHPIARGLPRRFDIPQTEMYGGPFHVPKPDEQVFEERWDAGEQFPSGCVWDLGKGRVFYFRPGHETYPVYRQAEPLRVVENAVRWLGSAARTPSNGR